MEIQFKKISFKNFLSYGNAITTFEFDKHIGTTLITGENGTGKTTIVNAILFALFNNTLSKMSKDDLINNINKKDMMVDIVFTIGKNQYQVIRTRKSSQNPIIIKLNDKEITKSSIVENDKFVQDLIGIPYELFVRIIIFSVNNLSYLSLSSSLRIQMIEELFGITELSEKAGLLKEEIKNTDTNKKMMENRISLIQKNIDNHKLQIEQTNKRKKDWEVKQKQQITMIDRSLKSIINIDFETEKQLHNAIDKLVSNRRDLKSKISDAKREQSAIVEKIERIERDSKKLRDNKCPYCLQEFAEAKDKLEKNRKEYTTLSNSLKKAEANLNKVNAELENLQLELEQKQSQITVENFEKLLKIKENQINLKERLNELKKETNPFEGVLSDLTLVELEEVDYSGINDIDNILLHQKFLLKLLTKKDSFIRQTILNNNIPFLNERIHEYVTFLGLPHRVEFMPDLSAKISQFGRELNFDCLSKGQAARVNLALSFAFRDVLQHIHKKVNICVFDEVLDSGLDSKGIQEAAKLLKHKAHSDNINLFIISHRDEIMNMFDRNIKISTKDRFSHIEYC